MLMLLSETETAFIAHRMAAYQAGFCNEVEAEPTRTVLSAKSGTLFCPSS